MPSLNNEMMRAIILDHYSHPAYKHVPNGEGFMQTHLHSENCIDDIDVYLQVEDDLITNACWNGRACAISSSSSDIMCSLLIGKNKNDALYIIEQYLKMIKEEKYDESVLDEALAFQNTSRQLSRIRCATLGWNGAKQIIEGEK